MEKLHDLTQETSIPVHKQEDQEDRTNTQEAKCKSNRGNDKP